MASDKSKYNEMVAKAWGDPAFKARLLKNPKKALGEIGVKIADDVSVEVVESTPQKLYIALPAAPSGELSDAALDAVAGGSLDVAFPDVCIRAPGKMLRP